MILSVIIPVRATTNIDVLERISWKRLDKQIPDSVEFVIVDDGSDLDNAKKIEEKCKELGYEYFYIPSSDKYFSLARARNKGVFEAKGQFVLIEDVDFAPYTGYYQDLIDEIYINNLDKETENFITLPSIWLTEPASKEFLADNSRFTSKKLIQKYFEYDLDYFEMGVPTGSCLLMSRHHYLSIGGQNESFDRWGFEDHEFANRLISFASKFPKPKNSDVYKNVVYTNYVDYEGFRAVYRLYGDVCANKGIYNFHIYHPINSEFRNQKIRQNNQELFEKCRKELSTNLYYLPYI